MLLLWIYVEERKLILVHLAPSSWVLCIFSLMILHAFQSTGVVASQKLLCTSIKYKVISVLWNSPGPRNLQNTRDYEVCGYILLCYINVELFIFIIPFTTWRSTYSKKFVHSPSVNWCRLFGKTTLTLTTWLMRLEMLIMQSIVFIILILINQGDI